MNPTLTPVKVKDLPRFLSASAPTTLTSGTGVCLAIHPME
jgi:hypothetical protein